MYAHTTPFLVEIGDAQNPNRQKLYKNNITIELDTQSIPPSRAINLIGTKPLLVPIRRYIEYKLNKLKKRRSYPI